MSTSLALFLVKLYFYTFEFITSHSLLVSTCATPFCFKLHHLLLSAIAQFKLTLLLPTPPPSHTHIPLPAPSLPPHLFPSDLGQIVLANDIGVDSNFPVAPDGQALAHGTMHVMSKFRRLKYFDLIIVCWRTWHYLHCQSLIKPVHVAQQFQNERCELFANAI